MKLNWVVIKHVNWTPSWPDIVLTKWMMGECFRIYEKVDGGWGKKERKRAASRLCTSKYQKPLTLEGGPTSAPGVVLTLCKITPAYDFLGSRVLYILHMWWFFWSVGVQLQWQIEAESLKAPSPTSFHLPNRKDICFSLSLSLSWKHQREEGEEYCRLKLYDF